ncbi:hypothetical protein BSKO_04044 [Bryopsis sp. KO-2023]|nr:hypothetical protein BSKO_04044 [Bryopsis sp. KO-2023]
MAPKKAAEREVQLSLLDSLFPPWNEAAIAAEKDTTEKFEDPFGLLLPRAVEPFLDEWKRAHNLVLNLPDVKMVELQSDTNGAQKGGGASRDVFGEMFSGHPVFDWMLAVFQSVENVKKQIVQGEYMWELIYPKDKDKQPMKTECGKYNIKLFIMDQWRQVVIDDRIPVDLFGRPLPVGVRPIQLWPLLISKALIKVMTAFKLLDEASPDNVPAFQWLTGWSQEDLSHPISGVLVEGGARFDRLERAIRESPRKEDRNSVAICCVKKHAAPERALPRLIVFCGPSGVGKGKLMDLLEECLPEKFSRTVSHTTRRPKEHEEHGKKMFFITRMEMDEAIKDNSFLETAEVSTSMGTNIYGTSLATVREVAATGKLCLMGMDLQGVKELQSNKRVDGLYIYVAPPSRELLEERLRGRRVEGKSTLQKRIDWAKHEVEKTKKSGIFDNIIENTNVEDVYLEIKEAISCLSPIIRNRLRGLPSYVLDYSDLIPSNIVEKPFLKPVLICGPTTGEKEILIKKLITEFPDVFGLPRRHTTLDKQTLGHQHTLRAEELVGLSDSDEKVDSPDDVILSKEEFEEFVQQKKFIEHHADMFVHPMIQERHGLTQEDMQQVLSEDKLCLLDVESDSVGMLRKKKIECLAIFLKPPSMEVFSERLDEWLQYREPVIQRMLRNADIQSKAVESSQIVDHVVVNDDIRDALDDVKTIISKYRPDIIPPKEEAEEKDPVQPALFLSGPASWINETLQRRLTASFPDKIVVPVQHTSRPPEKGEPEGVDFYFVKPDPFETMDQNGEFVYVREDPTSGHRYGVSWGEVNKHGAAGKMALVQCSVAGVEGVRERRVPNALCIFVSLPSVEGMEAEFRSRNPDASSEDITEFLEMSQGDLESARSPKIFDHVILDDDAEVLYADIQDAIAAHSPKVAPASHKPLVVAGPFGTGKRHLLRRVFDEYDVEFVTPVISSTHQQSKGTLDEMEPYETETEEQILHDIQEGKFLVHNKVLGNIYGIRKASVRKIQALGKVCVIDLDRVEDVEKLKKEGFNANYLFVKPDSAASMHHQLQEEIFSNPPLGYEPEEALELFYSSAKDEIDAADKSSTFEFKVELGTDHEASYCQLLESISNCYPSVIPPSNVWGFGRPLWDKSHRIYGHQPLKVIVLGPAAAGKTVLCEQIALAFDIPRVNVGELLYKEVQGKTSIGREAKKYMDASKTVPDEIFLEVVCSHLKGNDLIASGWVLDGFPHTKAQADKLVEMDIIADKVIFLECEHRILLDRVKCRRIDPLTGSVYHIPDTGTKALSETIRPMLDDRNVDEEALSRLTVRHDDLEDNVRNRLKFYDLHYEGLRNAFAAVSMTFSGQGSRDTILAMALEMIRIEHSHNALIEAIPSWKLKDAEYEVVDTIKYRREPLLLMHQADGKEFWVKMEELATNTKCLLLNQNPASFSHSQSITRGSMDDFTQESLLFIESPEPISILSSLFVGTQFPLEHPKTQVGGLVVVTGPSCVGKSILIDTIVEDNAEKVERVRRLTTCIGKAVGNDCDRVDRPKLDSLHASDNLACCYESFGCVFGVQKEEISSVQNSERLCLLELDPVGIACLRESGIDFTTVFISADIEHLDKRMRGCERLEEQEIQARLQRAETDLAAISSGEANYDHVIQSHDIRSCYNKFKEIISDYWPKLKTPSPCHMLVEFYNWEKTKPNKTCRRLITLASGTTTIHLPRGRHLLGFSADQEILHSMKMLSNTKFQTGDVSTILKEKENLSVQRFQGEYEAMSSDSWSLLFWYNYDVVEPCKVSAHLQTSSEKVQRYVKLYVIDNDESKESVHLLGKMEVGQADTNKRHKPIVDPFLSLLDFHHEDVSLLQVTLHQPNRNGYSIIGVLRCRDKKEIEAGEWRLTLTSDNQLKPKQQLTSRFHSFTGKYQTNTKAIGCRYKVNVSKRTQFCIRARFDPPAPLVLSILSPPKQSNGVFEWGAEEIQNTSRESASSLFIPGVTLDPGPYVVQMALAVEKCPFSVAEDGSIDTELDWTLEIAPTRDEKECPILEDDTKDRFLQIGKGQVMELDPDAHIVVHATSTNDVAPPSIEGKQAGFQQEIEKTSAAYTKQREMQAENEGTKQEEIKERLSSFRTWRQKALDQQRSMEEELNTTLRRQVSAGDTS